MLFIGLFIIISSRKPINTIASFEACVKSGNSVVDLNPRACRTKDGRVFIESTKTPSPTTSPSPKNTGTSPVPSPAEEANITISDPKPNQKIGTGYIVSGQARVFENVLQYRLKDANGTVLSEGNTSAQSPDVGQFGPFIITLRFDKPKTAGGMLEVFSSSPKDGLEINMVAIPVRF